MKGLLIILLLTFSTTAYNAEPLKGRELDDYIKKTEENCENTRHKMLIETRDKRIEECIETKEFTKAKCQSYYKDYGKPGVTKEGFRFSASQYDDIPECIEAQQARKMKGTER